MEDENTRQVERTEQETGSSSNDESSNRLLEESLSQIGKPASPGSGNPDRKAVEEAMKEFGRPVQIGETGQGADSVNRQHEEAHRATGGENRTNSPAEYLKERNNLDQIKEGLRGDKIKWPDFNRVQDLATGDTLVRDNGKEHLFMPNGDRLTVNKDGSYDLKTKEQVDIKSKDGVTTITYKNGDRVTIDQNGIRSIQRDDKMVKFPRLGGGGGGGDHRPREPFQPNEPRPPGWDPTPEPPHIPGFPKPEPPRWPDPSPEPPSIPGFPTPKPPTWPGNLDKTENRRRKS